mmetsp:Transcript_21702/g.65251  ORF Transcript_21702/g.65251 Transcript_21702/m.65251 type:complete len:80 (+) Transcript_21702:599-838(+)
MKPPVKLEDTKTQALALKLQLQASRGRNGCEAFECPHVSVAAPKMRAALDTLEAMCDPEDFIGGKDKDGLLSSSTSKNQ